MLIPTVGCNQLLSELGKVIAASPLDDWQKLCIVWAWVVACGGKLTDEQQDAMSEVAGAIAAQMMPDGRVLN